MLRSVGRTVAYAGAGAAGLYAAYAGATWLRYGHVRAVTSEERQPLLDQFMPAYEIVERHRARIEAPPAVTFAAARDVDFRTSPIIRAIFKARELTMGSDPDDAARPRSLVALTQSLGWRVLAEVPDREIVLGAVTRPWNANVVFRPIPPEEFAAFNEPDYVKIVWNLRADPAGDSASIFRSETRAIATDGRARRKFRRYWSFVSPGVGLIRRVALRLTKAAAERAASRGFSRGNHEKFPATTP